jgi:hypothetical protein
MSISHDKADKWAIDRLCQWCPYKGRAPVGVALPRQDTPVAVSERAVVLEGRTWEIA